MITVLTGGTGGAKFVDGLRQIVRPEDLTIIVNTGDDLLWWGLYVAPDIDSITYMLAGKLSQERGWGVKGDTFLCLTAMGQLGQPTWMHVGDRDLATHIFRSKLLAEGKTLTEATSEIATRLGIKTRILPMSNSRVETRVLTPAGDLSFEEYFVQRWFQDPVESVRFAGAADAPPAPGVIEAIRSADLVLLAPSNPVTSIGPILAVPGIREALRESRARSVAVSRSWRRKASPFRLPALPISTTTSSICSWSIRRMRPPPKPCVRPACACIALRPSCAKTKTGLRWQRPFWRWQSSLRRLQPRWSSNDSGSHKNSRRR